MEQIGEVGAAPKLSATSQLALQMFARRLHRRGFRRVRHHKLLHRPAASPGIFDPLFQPVHPRRLGLAPFHSLRILLARSGPRPRVNQPSIMITSLNGGSALAAAGVGSFKAGADFAKA